MEEIFNTELGRKILALTKASFRVSDLISDLVLREKIKHQSLVVFEKFIEKNHSEFLKEIDVLDHYFYLGGHLGLVKEDHLKSLRNGLLVFKSHIILLLNNVSNINQKIQANQSYNNRQFDSLPVLENLASNLESEKISLNIRQKKILEKFENRDTLKLSEVMDIFPGISEKTVRNELASLINLGKITRSGIGNGSFYKLVK